MIIYGSGMAGLLAANMLRRHNPIIREAQSSLPNNHEALLRFRSDKVAVATGIPFKEVKVSKAIKFEEELITKPNLSLSNRYSKKVTDAYYDRSINNLDPAKRYIAPLNFIELMSNGLTIEYGKKLDFCGCMDSKYNEGLESSSISTIPMPVMMDIVHWEKKPDFRFKTIWSKKTTIKSPDVDVYQTIYYPSKLTSCYRVSITGNVVVAEYVDPPPNNLADIYGFLRDDFGIEALTLAPANITEMKYGKLLPIDETLRKEFILYLTQEYNLFSVGRFATWRQLLLDDVVNDINVVDNLINNHYLINLHHNQS